MLTIASVIVSVIANALKQSLVFAIICHRICHCEGTEAISSLCDRRSQNQGSKPLIEDLEQAQLWQVLQDNSPDGGLWNGRKVADWLTSLTGRYISRQRGWEILRQMTFRLRVPRPAHTETSHHEQEAWKKN